MRKEVQTNAPAGAVYGLGLIGAAVYLFPPQQVSGHECWASRKLSYGWSY